MLFTFKNKLWSMRRPLWRSVAGVASAVMLGCAIAGVESVIGAESQAVEGKIQRLTTAPRGEVDGAILEDGTWLHWPPHLENRFSNAVKAGDKVRATGRTESGPKGDEHFEIETITNSSTNAKVENPDFGNAPPRPPRRPGRRPGPAFHPGRDVDQNRAETTEVKGEIARMTTAPRGEIDGAVLDNGTVLHWPPHLQTRFQEIVKVGERVRANGQMHTGPAGDMHLELSSVTNLQTNRTVENPDAIAARRPPLDQAGPNRETPVEGRVRDLEEQVKQLRSELDRLRKN